MHVKLFIPGPTEVREEVLKAQAKPMVGHRMPEFSEIYRQVTEDIRELFNTESYVIIFASSGSGAMEGAVRNLVDERLLSLVNGAFAERWAEIARSNGKNVDVLEVEWGRGVKAEDLEKFLKKKGENTYEAILITHNESSTGVMNNLQELTEVIKKYSPETLILVDAVSSLFGAPIKIDGWGLDVVITSSQKCLALPPGLAIVFVSKRAMEKAKKVSNRGWYFDFVKMLKYYEERGSTPATPAISLIYALIKQIDRIKKETLEARYQRHLEMAEIAREWASQYFELFPEKGYESHTLTAVKNTRGISVANLVNELKRKGYAISNGYGKLREITFRIGHMGDLTKDELKELLEVTSHVLGF